MKTDQCGHVNISRRSSPNPSGEKWWPRWRDASRDLGNLWNIIKHVAIWKIMSFPA